ncbi:stress response protein NST1-like isoform X1 [Oryzias latipes]|uniref:stress response protein NST1-like isoform X1 n=1 Tax=Oryzias latipes TaxID=8090 RepID=UPI000CE282B2|nr:stress response protein NST1-like isoform X1 [Oryzias latipes]
MSHAQTHNQEEQAEESAQVENAHLTPEEEAKTPRRSERIRSLTEKGKELQKEKLKAMERKYRMTYEKWRYHARISKEMLSDKVSKEELKEIIEDLQATSSAVQGMYDELRQVCTPESDLRRKVDTCMSLSRFIIQKTKRQLQGSPADEEEEPWPDVGSILNSTVSSSQSMSDRSKCDSFHSSVQSAKRRDAAACQEVLAVLEEQEKEAVETSKAEDKERLVQFESEKQARLQAIQDKRRKLERLEEVKKLNAAKARVEVYDQAEVSFIQGNTKRVRTSQNFPLTKSSSMLQIPRPPVIPTTFPAPVQTLDASSPPFIPQAITYQMTTPPTTTTHVQDGANFVSILAEAISANRLPTPEPTIFTENPLKFKGWQVSFQTLIDQKNIPKNEKLFYLQR